MPKVVQKRREPLELGLKGLSGAMQGATESDQINIQRRLQERDMARQEAALNEQVRSNDMQSSIAVRQLEILQSEGKLSRDQESRLQELMEGGRTSRHRSGLAQSDVESARQQQTSFRGQDKSQQTAFRGQDVQVRGQNVSASVAERGQDVSAGTAKYTSDQQAATARQGQQLGYQANIYGTDVGRQTAVDEMGLRADLANQDDAWKRHQLATTDTQFHSSLAGSREQLMTQQRHLNDIDTVMDSFEGDWNSLNVQQRNQAAEQLAMRTVGPQRWAGSGGVRAADDQEKIEATEQAARSLANRDRLQETIFNRVVAYSAATNADRDGDIQGMNMSMTRQPISPSELFSIPTDGGPSTINYDSIHDSYGPGGTTIANGIEDMLEQQISELAGTGIGPVGHNRDVQINTLNRNISSLLSQWDIPEKNKEDLMEWAESNFVVALEEADKAAEEAAAGGAVDD